MISRTIFFWRAETPGILAAGVGIDHMEGEDRLMNMHIFMSSASQSKVDPLFQIGTLRNKQIVIRNDNNFM